MGSVYEAEQDQPQRRVALKVIRPDFIMPELVRRFSRESEVLGRLQHPGIAQIYEAGTFEDSHGPQPFFAMELVKGQPVTEYARARTLDVKQRLELFARICDAVHYAHQQGVVHRDLKPANILVDAAGQPKILDFGIALLTDADVQATRQTSVGEVVGTLQYMSPEQVNADPALIDSRSDVYSLGVILYELLAGRLPYDLTRKLIYEAARVILIDDPAPLSSIDRNLRGDTEIIVSKALEKEPGRRYGSAEDLASDVRRFLRDEPIAARAPSAMYQLRKFARRNRALVSGLAFAAVILIAGTAVSLWQAVRATTAERLAESRRGVAVAAVQLAERRRSVADSALRVADSARAAALSEQAAATASAERATGEAAKAQAVNTFLQEMLGSSDPSNARGKELRVRDVLDQAAARVGTGDLARQPGVRAGVETTIGRTYFALGLYDQARPHLDSAYAIRRRLLGPTSVEAGESAGDLGAMSLASGDYVAAEKSLTDALAVKRATLREDDDQITATLASLADVRYRQGNNADAERLYRKALRLTRSRHGNSGIAVASRLQSLGNFLTYTGKLDKAVPLLEESLAIRRRAYGDIHPQVVDAFIALSEANRSLQKFAETEAGLRQALPIAHTLYGASHPVIADILSRLGGVMSDQSRVEQAEPLLRQALAMRITLLGREHPDVQLARVELARLLIIKAQYAEADTLFEQALQSRRTVLGDMSPAVAASLTDLGYLAKVREDWVLVEKRHRAAIPIWKAANIEDEEINSLAEVGFALVKQEKFDDAGPILANVLSRRIARYGANHWAVGDAYEKLAAAAMSHGDTAKAESLSLSGLAIRRTVYGDKSSQVANQLPNVAYLREVQGDTSGAIPYLRESLAILQEIRPETAPSVLGAQRLLAIDLCTTGATAEGDSLMRRAIAHAPLDSMQSMPYRLRASLGYCLTRQHRFAEAEPLLLAAEAGLRAIPTAPATQRSQAVLWLVRLYEQWGRPAAAAEWRGQMAPVDVQPP